MTREIEYLVGSIKSAAARNDYRSEDDIERYQASLMLEISRAQHPRAMPIALTALVVVWAIGFFALETAYPPWLKSVSQFVVVALAFGAAAAADRLLNARYRRKLYDQCKEWLIKKPVGR
jgi:hypothetical protein